MVYLFNFKNIKSIISTYFRNTFFTLKNHILKKNFYYFLKKQELQLIENPNISSIFFTFETLKKNSYSLQNLLLFESLLQNPTKTYNLRNYDVVLLPS